MIPLCHHALSLRSGNRDSDTCPTSSPGFSASDQLLLPLVKFGCDMWVVYELRDRMVGLVNDRIQIGTEINECRLHCFRRWATRQNQ